MLYRSLVLFLKKKKNNTFVFYIFLKKYLLQSLILLQADYHSMRFFYIFCLITRNAHDGVRSLVHVTGWDYSFSNKGHVTWVILQVRYQLPALELWGRFIRCDCYMWLPSPAKFSAPPPSQQPTPPNVPPQSFKLFWHLKFILIR